jgi:hypothetical protein
MKTLWSLIGLGGGKKPNSKEVMLDLGGNVVLDRHLLPDYEPVSRRSNLETATFALR